MRRLGLLLIALLAGCQGADLGLDATQFACGSDDHCEPGFLCQAGVCVREGDGQGVGTDGGDVDAGSNDAGANDAGSNDAGSNDAGANDAGANDAGANDAGANDAGADDAGANDAGSNDAGSNDAGANDAGSNDAGSNDAGSNDAGSDGGLDAGTDAGLDGGVDAGIDSGIAVTDGGPCLAPGSQTRTARFVHTQPSSKIWVGPPTAARDSDDVRLVVTLEPGEISHRFHFSNFDLDIPDHAEILGIQFQVERSGSGLFTVQDHTALAFSVDPFRFWENKPATQGFFGTDQVVTYGGPTDLWGTVWTPDILNSPGFGFLYSVQTAGATVASTVSVDQVTAQVFFRTAEKQGPYSARSVAVSSSGKPVFINPHLALTRGDGGTAVISFSGPAETETLALSNFGFSLPPTERISGVQVKVDAWSATANATRDGTLFLFRPGTLVPSADRAKQDLWPADASVRTYGGLLDPWFSSGVPPNGPLMGAHVNDAGFGVALTLDFPNASGGYSAIDHVEATVFYRPDAGSVTRKTDGGPGYPSSVEFVHPTPFDGGSSVASVLATWRSGYLISGDHDFTIPNGAIINGITARIRMSTNAAGVVETTRVSLIRDGALHATNRRTTAVVPVIPEERTYGSSTDPWGATWGPANTNRRDFGVAIHFLNTATDRSADVTARIVDLTVSYTCGN